jgi:MFS family permease
MMGSPMQGLSWRVIATVTMGTTLNPLNSSMIAVALLSAASDLHVDIPAATWLVSSFYLVGATGMPLAGRLADLYGPRRVFRGGLMVVLVASALAALAPSFAWLLVWRIVQAFGSAAGSPAGQATIRAQTGTSRPPVHALGAVSMANNLSAALGPVIGGLMVSLAGWQGIFWINIPVALVGLAMAWRWLPPDGSSAARPAQASRPSVRLVLRELDMPGVCLFALTVVGLLAFLLSAGRGPDWPLLAASVIAGVLLVLRERSQPNPFLDVRFLANNRRLVLVYADYAAVNLIFYGAFFGLPVWLQQARHFTPALVGLVVLPISGMSVLMTPVAARLIARRGSGPARLIGACFLLIGVLLQLTLDAEAPVWRLVVATAMMGIGSGFNNLGLQSALYQFAPSDRTGTAAGQFQTSRYIGATLCTALLGIVFVGSATTEGLHILALSLLPVALLLIVASVLAERPPRHVG